MKERCRSGQVDCVYESDEEELEDLYQQLRDEREILAGKKDKLETEYHKLYTHVFNVSKTKLCNTVENKKKTPCQREFLDIRLLTSTHPPPSRRNLKIRVSLHDIIQTEVRIFTATALHYVKM